MLYTMFASLSWHKRLLSAQGTPRIVPLRNYEASEINNCIPDFPFAQRSMKMVAEDQVSTSLDSRI